MDIETAFALHRAGQYDRARAIYHQILKHASDDYNALQLLGALELNAGDYCMAANLISKAVGIIDQDPSAYNNLGEAYRGLSRFSDAEMCFRRALFLDSTYAIAYNNLAVVLQHLKRPREAVEACRNAILFSPGYAEAFNNLGIILADLNEMVEAEAAYKAALGIQPDYLAPYVNLGILYKNAGHYAEAEIAYNNALRLNPSADEALYNLSILELLQGKLRKGFEHYEQRTEKHDIMCEAPQNCSLWHGERLTGKTLLIIAEQGAGDFLMMLRYVRKLQEKMQPSRIGVYCDKSLHRIVRSFLESALVFSKGEKPPFNQFDCYSPLMSLPYLFKTTLRSIPHRVPYIKAPTAMVKRWQQRLSALSGYKVGLAWAGNEELAADAKRSIPLILFKPLLEVPGVHFISLQKGLQAEQLKELNSEVLDVMEECSDYQDTAALIACLDLVVSVDTSVVHLAGAMGKKTWLLNRHESEWRWMLGREDSPWYPTVKIIRQRTSGDWDYVVQLLAGMLEKTVSEPSLSKKYR